jgi:hypothetical protein
VHAFDLALHMVYWISPFGLSQIDLLGVAGKVVSKFCAKYLHKEVLKSEAYQSGDLGKALEYAFLR